jgi:hypothetical protein
MLRWSEIEFQPSTRTLRQFAAMCVAVFGCLAAYETLRNGVTTRCLIWNVLALVGVVGLIRPQTLRLIFVASMIVAWPMGWLVSHVILAVLYFGMFTPVAVVFRLLGRDALALRRPQRKSYWTAKPTPRDVRRYFRQY